MPITKKQEKEILENMEKEMTETLKKDKILMLKNVRLSFPVLFEAKAFSGDPKSKKEFSAAFLIPKDSPAAAEIKAALVKVANDKWGEKGLATLQNLFRDERVCLHDGERKDYEGYEGNYYLRASNITRPLVIDGAKNPVTEADGKVYSGCYVNASIRVWAQDNKFGKRINANLRGVQLYADGEAFAGGGAADTDEFESEEGAPAASLDSFGF